jgi:hypothetical protein
MAKVTYRINLRDSNTGGNSATQGVFGQSILVSGGYTKNTNPPFTHGLNGRPQVKSVEGLQGGIWKPVDLKVIIKDGDEPTKKVFISPVATDFLFPLRINLLYIRP